MHVVAEPALAFEGSGCRTPESECTKQRVGLRKERGPHGSTCSKPQQGGLTRVLLTHLEALDIILRELPRQVVRSRGRGVVPDVQAFDQSPTIVISLCSHIEPEPCVTQGNQFWCGIAAVGISF